MSTVENSDQELICETFPVGPLACNCAIIGDRVSRQALVVDPGGDAQRILRRLEELQLKVRAIIHTHAHLDHILAAGEIKNWTGAPIFLHQSDYFLWENLEAQCRMFGVPYVAQPDPDQWLQDDQALDCADGVCMHTPGHSPGSVCFWFERTRLLIAGDTLFRRAIGRTDLWGGDAAQIERSICQRIYRLDETARVITGHGPETTIGEELRENPFFRASH